MFTSKIVRVMLVNAKDKTGAKPPQWLYIMKKGHGGCKKIHCNFSFQV
jgi:hypothetical protein